MISPNWLIRANTMSGMNPVLQFILITDFCHSAIYVCFTHIQ